MADVNLEQESLEVKLTTTEKVTKFLKRNLINIALFFGCAIFIAKGIANIEPTGKTILEILADGLVSFIFGFLIKSLLSENGIIAGRRDTKYLRTIALYGKKLDEIESYIEYVDPFCDYKNKYKLKREQSIFLRKHGLIYKKFINNEYDDKDNLKDIVEQCRNITITKITSNMIINSLDDNEDDTAILKMSVGKYRKKTLLSTFVIGISIALLFGYYTLGKGTVEPTAIIWASLQVVMFLLFGLWQYVNSFQFITEDYRGKIIRIIGYLDEFINLYNKNPNIFVVEEDEIEKVEQLPSQPIKESEVELNEQVQL